MGSFLGLKIFGYVSKKSVALPAPFYNGLLMVWLIVFPYNQHTKTIEYN